MPARHVLITGASGQLGSCLCRRLSRKEGQLSLCGHDSDGLEELAELLRREGRASITATALDVRNADALTAWVRARGKVQPIDWVIVNAGLGGQVKAGEILEPAQRSAELIDVNLSGAINTIHAVLPELQRGSNPRLTLVSSLSAIIGFDKAPVYAATKAAIRVLALSLRPALAEQGITVTVACPGFLDQPMTLGSRGWRPFSIDADRAAEKILDAAESGKAQITFPLGMALYVRTLAMLPIPMREFVHRRMSN